MDVSPYWKEEGGISILADGYLGFVFDSKYLKAEPAAGDIISYQIINNEFTGSSIIAVKTALRLGYKGNVFKTFISPRYAMKRMKKIYDDAFAQVMAIRDQITETSDLLSARQLSRIVAVKKYFLYITTVRKNDVGDLIGKLDFTYTKCRQAAGKSVTFRGEGENESILINSDNIIMDMSACYDMGFRSIVLPAKKFQEQARFLSFPLGADPGLLSRMGLLTGVPSHV